MNPETKFVKIRGVAIALVLTILMLPILGLWAAASYVENVIQKIIRMNTPKMGVKI